MTTRTLTEMAEQFADELCAKYISGDIDYAQLDYGIASVTNAANMLSKTEDTRCVTRAYLYKRMLVALAAGMKAT